VNSLTFKYLSRLKHNKTNYQFFIFILCLFTGLKAIANDLNLVTNYKSDVFTDKERINRVKATAKHVRSMYQEILEQKNIPGLAYGVVLDGQLIYANGLGLANVEQQISANPQSLFRTASLSKNFTAIAIFQLRDANKLSLDDPVERYLPVMKNVRYFTSDSPKITIRHLLNHRGGLPKDGAWADVKMADTDLQFQQLIDGGISLANVPGTINQYSGLGYALLGKVIEKISGLPFDQYTQQHILKPLEMQRSVWEFSNANPKLLATGYKWRNNQHTPIPFAHHGAFGAIGGLISSVEDFSLFAKLHLDAWPARNGDDNGILKRSSLREMHVPGPITNVSTSGDCLFVRTYRYGLGWQQACDGIPYLYHHGGLPGFSANWTMSPQHGLAIISFSNRGGVFKINEAPFKYILNEAKLIHRQQQVPSLLKKFQQTLYKLLTNQAQPRPMDEIFAENLLPKDNMEMLLKSVKKTVSKTGKIIKTNGVTPINQLTGRFIIEGKLNHIEVIFMLTPESKPLIHQLKVKIIIK